MSIETRLAANQRVISHRGGGALAPENTLSGIKYARNLGFHNTHFDVRLTADGVPVLQADDSSTSASGKENLISELFFDQISETDVGSIYGNEYAGESMPTLYQALGTCKEHEMLPLIELLPAPGQERSIAQIAVDILRKVWDQRALSPIFISANASTLEAIMEEEPTVARGLKWNSDVTTNEDEHQNLQCQTILIPGRLITSDLVRALHRNNHLVIATNVNDSADATALIHLKVDAIMTDQIDMIGPYFF